jgi:2-amino-4-hydroxy-6-hydroxymethyldihydropteridine diphosphokinase
MITCYIGLGSNLENPVEQVSTALKELSQIPDTTLEHASSLYRSDPVGPPGQPDYINAVACLITRLEPHALLDQLQAIEQAHDRKRIQHWGPRTLDLDLILYGDHTLATERLNVPHPYAKERAFVLWPLAEIANELTFPDGTVLSELLVQCPVGSLEKISL